MSHPNTIQPAQRSRTAFDSGRASRPHSVAPSQQSVPERASAPERSAIREVLFVAACIGASIVMWGALLWLLASSLEVPTLF